MTKKPEIIHKALALIPQETVETRIFLVRGQKVMFDKDLALFYGITTRDLNKTVTRNIERFPADFMFQLSTREFDNLMFHFGTSSWGGTRKKPRVFTEHGILMLSSVVRSKIAIHVNIQIMRAFVKLRKIIAAHKELSDKIAELEQRLSRHDREIQSIFTAIRQLMAEPAQEPKPKIGFHQK